MAVIGILGNDKALQLIGGGEAEYKALENRTKELETNISNKLDISKISNGSTITQEGYAADARQLNPSINGSIANLVNTNKNTIQSVNSDLTSKINSANSAISSANSNISTLANVLHRFTQDQGLLNQYTGNLNDITVTSVYNCFHQNVTNYPSEWGSGYWSFIITFVHSLSNLYVTQIAIVMNLTSTHQIATRYKLNGAWNSWRYVHMD